MQPTILIPRIADAPVSAAEIVSVMDNAHLPFIPVAHSCWAELFPYKPQVEVRLAHTGSHLLIHYRVSEACVRAVASHDNGNVWEDSCCELFLSPTDDGTYYNIECNAAGTMLIGAGAARANRERANQEVLNTVDRFATMGRMPFADIEGERTWQLCLSVPATALFHHKLQSFTGLQAHGNVYKCGDKLPRPHFVSLFPVDVPKPDFHRPDFFGSMLFE